LHGVCGFKGGREEVSGRRGRKGYAKDAKKNTKKESQKGKKKLQKNKKQNENTKSAKLKNRFSLVFFGIPFASFA
jgi:hypothetical protein